MQDGGPDVARFEHPCGLATDGEGNLYVADCGNHLIRKVSAEGEVSTVAGTGEEALKDGKADAAAFSSPVGIAASSLAGGHPVLYVTDYTNNAARSLAAPPPTPSPPRV